MCDSLPVQQIIRGRVDPASILHTDQWIGYDGQVLPKIRAQVDQDLRLPNLAREKVIATVVRLLEISSSESATKRMPRKTIPLD